LRTPGVFCLALAGCAGADTFLDHTFDPCGSLRIEGRDDTVEAALELWRAHGAVLDDAPDAPLLVVEQVEGPPDIYGYYDDEAAILYLNTRVTDPTARAIVVAHELGHAFALDHVDAASRASVMNRGNLTIAPTAGDGDALAAIWGACTR
jgi:hypothetical protein